MKIFVAQSDIENGRACLASNCPIALAMCRATGISANSGRWLVGAHTIVDATSLKQYNMPEEAVQFVSVFDRCTQVQPFSFELNIEEKGEQQLSNIGEPIKKHTIQPATEPLPTKFTSPSITPSKTPETTPAAPELVPA